MQGFYSYGDTVTYTCDEGYRLEGNGTLKCIVTYTCDDSYHLEGNSNQKCTENNAIWDSALPVCIGRYKPHKHIQQYM